MVIPLSLFSSEAEILTWMQAMTGALLKGLQFMALQAGSSDKLVQPEQSACHSTVLYSTSSVSYII